ncbi:hypothetical protein ACFLSV_07750 [Bacteroidota bacterium]
MNFSLSIRSLYLAVDRLPVCGYAASFRLIQDDTARMLPFG